MIDILPYIASKIKGVCTVEEEFPPKGATFPIATIVQRDNSSDVVLNKAERLSTISILIDVSDNSQISKLCKDTAIAISNIVVRLVYSWLNVPVLQEKQKQRTSFVTPA